MNVKQLAIQAAAMRAWPARNEMNGDVRIEIPTIAGRSQVVTISMGTDGDNDPVAFIWASAGDMRVLRDPIAILRLNAQLTYGKVALRGDAVVIVHALLDSAANLPEVGKTLYWVARSADELERQTYGTDTL